MFAMRQTAVKRLVMGGATIAERWSVSHRVREVEVAPDGAIWIAEDANPGGLYRVTPK